MKVYKPFPVVNQKNAGYRYYQYFGALFCLPPKGQQFSFQIVGWVEQIETQLGIYSRWVSLRQPNLQDSKSRLKNTPLLIIFSK